MCAKDAQKCAQKYAKNKHNHKKWGRVGYPISHHPCTFVTKYDDIFDQEEVLIILSTLKPPFNFFSRKNWSFGVQKFKEVKNIHPKPIILMGLPRKIAKYIQNMRKYTEICAARIPPAFLTPYQAICLK